MSPHECRTCILKRWLLDGYCHQRVEHLAKCMSRTMSVLESECCHCKPRLWVTAKMDVVFARFKLMAQPTQEGI